MGYICPSCGEGLPEDTPCPCEMGYELDDDEHEWAPFIPANDEQEEWVRLILAAEIGPPIPGSAPPDDISSQGECPGECLAHRQHIYILCYGRPVLVRSRDYLRDDPSRKYPISHYVGWTRQLPPIERVRQHGAKSAHYVAQIRPGTMLDEERAKRFEPCPRCGKSLWYFAESPTYLEEYANNALPGQGGLLLASERRKVRPGPD
jgi:predicted RNA-binding Zn-ribbon protein involved in translation (DUF1610 family)